MADRASWPCFGTVGERARQLGALFINGEQEMAVSRVRTRSRADFVQKCEKLSCGQLVDRSGGAGR